LRDNREKRDGRKKHSHKSRAGKTWKHAASITLGDFPGDTEREDVSCLSGAAVLGLRVAKLAGYGFEEVTAPNANHQSRPEEDYGVKASEVAAPSSTFSQSANSSRVRAAPTA
jgi:hypothetical protein